MLKIIYWIFSLTAISILLIIAILTHFYFAPHLVSAEEILRQNDQGVILQDRFGQTFFNFYQSKNRQEIPVSEISQPVLQAAVASEDKDFYSHNGFSPKAIARSIIDNIKIGQAAYGGSTITQQLVKNTLLNPNKNLIRKYQEILLAEDLEQRFSKDQILGMYLNSVYFGDGAFGIEQAAKIYFNKQAKDLDLSEASLLIGLLPAPSKYSPLSGSLEGARDRQRIVLSRMVENNMISENEANNAYSKELSFNPQTNQINNLAPHFALMVLDELIQKYGQSEIQTSGFIVKTTLDLDKQKIAEQTVKTEVQKLAINKATNGAAVVLDPKTGEILSMVGSKDWYDSQNGKINMAISPRQPGSAFKPIVYSKAFENQIITPATTLPDSPTTFPGNYKPKDYDGKFRGTVTARRALANSLNIPSVEVLRRLGVDLALENARDLGITTLEDSSQYGLSLVLGAGEVPLTEMVDAYSTFANNGSRNSITSILEVQDKYREVIYQYEPSPKQVLSPETTFLISSILSDNNTRAEVFGNTLNISRPAAVKTGTSEDYRDAWTIGYTPSLVVGVWVGNNDNKPMDNVAGSLGAAPIWKDLMETYLEGTPIEEFSAYKNQ